MAVRENRHKVTVQIAKVPTIFTEENRGWDECCEPFQVLFHATDSTAWKNDVTSAWSLGDTVTFTLKKDGVTTTYTPSAVAFPNEPNAYYTTINWRDVYNTDGIGCYDLYITVGYAGLTAEKLWGKYDLQPYEIDGYLTARGTVRLRSVFNDVNTFEGINFTGAYVVDDLRLKAKFGYWNDNTEIDNVLFTDDEKVKVKRENLTEYELRVDLHRRCIIDRLRFHLVAENACYITDHNPDNYSYQYLDYPVIVKEGFSPNWFDGTRRVKGVAKFEDKKKRTKTHFQDNDGTGEMQYPEICSGGEVVNSDSSYTNYVSSGATLTLPDSQVNVNGSNEGDVVSVKTININVDDGTDPVTPDAIDITGNTITLSVPKDLEIYIPYSSGDTSVVITIITGSDGTITSADTTGLTSVAYDINGSPASLPLTLAVADVLTITFDAAGSDGVIVLTGSYA